MGHLLGDESLPDDRGGRFYAFQGITQVKAFDY